MLEESDLNQILPLKITYENSASGVDPDYEEVKFKESQSLVTQTLKHQNPRSGLGCDQPLKSEV